MARRYAGISKVLRGIIRYRQMHRQDMVRQFKLIKDDPRPDAVFFTCIDSRMLPTRFTSTKIGDMFIVRNAGNLVPHAYHCKLGTATTEPAALELGCIVNNVNDIVVCGHSDCKAINLLYKLRDPESVTLEQQRLSPLKSWLFQHAQTSLRKFMDLQSKGFHHPVEFQGELPLRNCIAYIDPENKFSLEDKLSQVNTLQQMENIASYSFLKSGLENDIIHIHAFWFDIYTGDMYYFSRREKQFIPIDEENISGLLDEASNY